MRDKSRIHRICQELEVIWEQVPDWRFGQLLSNMLGDICYKNEIRDIFFPEDDKWERWLKEYPEGFKQ